MSSCRMVNILAVGGTSEDSAVLRAVAEKEGAEVFFFPSSSGALEWCREKSPDIAVVDSRVPPSGSREFVRLLRALRGGGDIPLLLMTDAGERQLRREVLEEGAADFLDFLARPLDPGECAARLRSACAFRRQQKLLREQRKEREQAEEEARRTADYLKAVRDASPDMIFLLDEAGSVADLNDNALREYGYAREDLPALSSGEATGRGFPWEDARESIREALHGGKSDFERVARRKNGEEFPVTVRLRKLAGQGRNGGEEEGRAPVVAVVRDIARWKMMEQQLHTLAFFDSLTGLPNRTLFFDRLHHSIAFARRNNRMVGLLFLDLDGFQSLNDTFGHSAGDQVLERTAKRLKGCVRESDTVARMGSDEFALILTAIAQEQDAALVSEKIIHAFDAPFLLDGKECFIGASIGISLYPDNGDDVHTLLKKADIAMYRVKDRGRNSYKFYREAL